MSSSVRFAVAVSLLGLALAASGASAQIVAYDMVGSTSQNLTSYTNAYTGAFSSAGDGFQKYQRGVSPSIPFSVLDDSLTFATDSLGIIKTGNTDEFFGATDTINGENPSGPVSATWVFDISGAGDLGLSIDMGAMGDFEASGDYFTWEYSIDGGPSATAFASSVDETDSQTYTLEDGDSFTLSDPMLVDGVMLSNNLATFVTAISGTGSELTLTLTLETNGGTEAIAFQNLVIVDLDPTGPIAWDMVGSTSQNLTSYTNAYTGAFSSAGDGFQKYQRGVSPSIPFSVLDDSLTFATDSLGIIKTGNTDEFFGATDTINGENPSGPVSATWVFDISGASGLGLSIDMGAMGDFEASGDYFEWTYSIDGGPVLTAFSSTVDETGSQTYTLEDGDSFTLSDPMLVDGVMLSNDLATFATTLTGTGTELTLTLTLETNGGTEAMAFQNLVIVGGGPPPPPGIAYDMVESMDLNLTSFTNPYNGAFGSPADGFQKYQRGVSASIPFAVLDDSSTFSSDSLGIIKTANEDEFFGATDTENPENSGPVSATWVFDVSGGNGVLGLSIDMGAMGDFESSDFFEWTYSIDGGPELTAFSSSVDEAGSQTYILEDGDSFTLNDPLTVQGTALSNELATFSASLFGSGSELSVTLTIETNGGSEAMAFQNLIVTDGNSDPPATPEVEIYEIQGSGLASFFNGAQVITNDNVVTAVGTNGFFMQTPASRTDGDVDTSDGIFVFTGAAPGVAVGDLVDVAGEVDEFFGFTEITDATVTVAGQGVVPAPIALGAFVPSGDPVYPSCAIEYECLEGMLVEIADGTVTGPNQRFGSDPIAEVFITANAARTFREPGIEYPGVVGYPVWDGNPEVFELDPDKLGLPNEIIPAGSSFTATGVIGYEFGGYELWPSSLSFVPNALPQAVRLRGPGEMTVGSLNLFRLFDDLDDPVVDGRNDAVVSTAEYLRRRVKFVSYILEVLGAPEILAVQEAEKLEVLEALAADILAVDPSVAYTAHLIEGNDIGTIDVGFLVRSNIAVDALTQVDADALFTFDDPPSPLHDRPPLLLEGRYLLDYGSFPISVMVVHNRSLSGIDTERTQRKRFEQAESIAAKVQEIQAAAPAVRLVVIGDFNAYEFSDGYVDPVGIISGDFDPAESLFCSANSCVDLVDPDLVNLTLALDPSARYSFIFGGSAQVLDHALISQGLAAEITGVEYGRGNADAAVDLINDDGSVEPLNLPLRSSDHDGLVVFINKDFDSDGVPNDDDVCPGTVIPESVPTVRLGVNRFALVDGDGVFDTTAPRGRGSGAPQFYFDIGMTAGCSCEQIIEAAGLGDGHEKFGCSGGEMLEWVELVNP